MEPSEEPAWNWISCPRCRERVAVGELEEHLERCRPVDPLP